jgi:hypothetical protein
VRAVHKAVAIALLGGLASLQAVNCLERTDLTPAEQECCQQMVAACGHGSMPESHSCCTKELKPIEKAAKQQAWSSEIGVPEMQVEAPGGLANLIARPQLSSVLFDSPPESPPPAVSILRI